jgi:aryl-alcohol dehydrogenase-like predicted oxidoreductase
VIDHGEPIQWKETVQLPEKSLEKVISGGQTGVDRAALDWALANGIAHGGWCPRGRRAEDGVLPAHYLLQETESAGYRQRTKRNIQDSDGTLIVNRGELTGGTLLTQDLARKLGKPCHVIDAEHGPTPAAAAALLAWITANRVRTLNIAGPRESKQAGIYSETVNILNSVRRFHMDT